MPECPIIFSAPMVRALLDGRKTQTRRVVTSFTSFFDGWGRRHPWGELDFERAWIDNGPSPAGNPGPYLQVPWPTRDTVHRVYPRLWEGDTLWVRETWASTDQAGINPEEGGIVYRATDPDWSEEEGWRWRSPIHMPRWASRITLEITAVRVQRIQEISSQDAALEGVRPTADQQPPGIRMAFKELWDSINAKRGFPWADNPWVWVLEFKLAEGGVPMDLTKCPWCGAGLRKDATGCLEDIARGYGDWACGSFKHGAEPHRSDSCRLEVAERELEKAQADNKRLRAVVEVAKWRYTIKLQLSELKKRLLNEKYQSYANCKRHEALEVEFMDAQKAERQAFKALDSSGDDQP